MDREYIGHIIIVSTSAYYVHALTVITHKNVWLPLLDIAPTWSIGQPACNQFWKWVIVCCLVNLCFLQKPGFEGCKFSFWSYPRPLFWAYCQCCWCSSKVTGTNQYLDSMLYVLNEELSHYSIQQLLFKVHHIVCFMVTYIADKLHWPVESFWYHLTAR